MLDPNRRPLKTRNLAVMQKIAAWLALKRVSPNLISGNSMAFSLGSLICFALTGRGHGAWPWLLAAAFVQLRLLANLLDGMVAVEGGLHSKLGGMFNEVPDRISDTLTLVGLDLASGGSLVWGLACALAAVFTAYLRAFAAGEGLGQIFAGPMAKPQRMFWVTVCALLMAFLPQSWTRFGEIGLVQGFLWFICLGTLVTAIRRTIIMIKGLHRRD